MPQNDGNRTYTNGSQSGVTRRQRTTAGDINEGPPPDKINRYVDRAAEGYIWDDTASYPPYGDWISFPHLATVGQRNRVNTIPNPAQSADTLEFSTPSVGDPLR